MLLPQEDQEYNNTNMKEANWDDDEDNKGRTAGCSRLVEVNMDGDPVGRKVDLNAHHSYETLAHPLELPFHEPTIALGTFVRKLLPPRFSLQQTIKKKTTQCMISLKVDRGKGRLGVQWSVNLVGVRPYPSKLSELGCFDCTSRTIH